MNKEYQKNYYQANKAKFDVYNKNRREQLKANKLCNYCKQPLSEIEISKCTACKEKVLKRRNELKQQRLELGLCILCNKESAIQSKKVGEICYLKTILRDLKWKSSEFTVLQQLLISQDNKCPYTGVTLIIGYNTELDHIVPRSKGGTDKLSNLQWTLKPVNQAKHNLSHEEFVTLCKQIANHLV